MAKFIAPELQTNPGLDYLLLNPLEPFTDRMVLVQAEREAELKAPWTPYPKQALATQLAGEVDELLFGGAAGPGKTEWLLRYGVDQMERYAGNRGVIFRRVFPSLQRSIIPRLQAMLVGRAKWNGQTHTFTFPNDSILECASLQYLHTVNDFQGAEYGWMGFEEITEFHQAQWEFLIGRLRVPATADPEAGIRPHACATTNPGGIGHKWVKRRWVSPKPDDLEVGQMRPGPGEPWRPRFDPMIHTEDAPPLLRAYVPAVYTDNPALLKKDPGYLSKIRANSNKGMRKALEDGDWDALESVEGALWTAEDLDLGRIAPERYRKEVQVLRRVVAVDPSDGDEGGDAYGVAVCARGADGRFYVEETHEWSNLTPKKLAQMTLRLYARVQGDAIVVEKNHGGRWLTTVFEMVDPYVNLQTVWASEKKQTRAEPVAVLFEWTEGNRPESRASMVGYQEAAEDEMTQTSFTTGEDSPNILDAIVWGGSFLMLNKGQARSAATIRDQRLAGRR